MCAGALLQAHVSRLVFGAWDEKAGAAGSRVRRRARSPAALPCRGRRRRARGRVIRSSPAILRRAPLSSANRALRPPAGRTAGASRRRIRGSAPCWPAADARQYVGSHDPPSRTRARSLRRPAHRRRRVAHRLDLDAAVRSRASPRSLRFPTSRRPCPNSPSARCRCLGQLCGSWPPFVQVALYVHIVRRRRRARARSPSVLARDCAPACLACTAGLGPGLSRRRRARSCRRGS